MQKTINKVGRPKKEDREMIPSMLSISNIWRLAKLKEKYNKDNEKAKISRSDIINDAVTYLCDMEDIPQMPIGLIEKPRSGVEL